MAPAVVLVVGDFAQYPDVLQLPVIKKAFDDTTDLPDRERTIRYHGHFRPFLHF